MKARAFELDAAFFISSVKWDVHWGSVPTLLRINSVKRLCDASIVHKLEFSLALSGYSKGSGCWLRSLECGVRTTVVKGHEHAAVFCQQSSGFADMEHACAFHGLSPLLMQPRGLRVAVLSAQYKAADKAVLPFPDGCCVRPAAMVWRAIWLCSFLVCAAQHHSWQLKLVATVEQGLRVCEYAQCWATRLCRVAVLSCTSCHGTAYPMAGSILEY